MNIDQPLIDLDWSSILIEGITIFKFAGAWYRIVTFFLQTGIVQKEIIFLAFYSYKLAFAFRIF